VIDLFAQFTHYSTRFNGSFNTIVYVAWCIANIKINVFRIVVELRKVYVGARMRSIQIFPFLVYLIFFYLLVLIKVEDYIILTLIFLVLLNFINAKFYISYNKNYCPARYFL